MNALISGSAGVALVIDGGRLFSIDVDRIDEITPRDPSEARLLFGDARDQWTVQGASLESVKRLLDEAWRGAEALELALILLDADLSERTRGQAAEELEEALAASGTAERVEAVLYGKPLPPSAAVEAAARICETKGAAGVEALLARLRERQAEIREVADAFERIPTGVFGDEADRGRARAALVREGIFRELVLARAAAKSVAALVAAALQRAGVKAVKNHRSVLQAWIKPLAERRAAARALTNDDADEGPGSDDARSGKPARVGVDRAKVLQKVTSQKQIISGAIARNELARAYGLVDELVAFQLRNGAPIYAVKSLCDLAMEAQRRGAFELQVDLLQRATKLKADDGWAWAQMGKALLNLHRHREALLAYESALMFGEPLIAKNGRAEVLKAMGRLDDALRAYDQAAREHPSDVVAKNGRAEVLRAMGRLDDALQAYEQAARAHPENVIAKSARAEILKTTGRLDDALRAYDQAAREHPSDVVPKTGRAEALKAMGRLDDALQAYEQAAKEHPRNVVAKNGRAEVLKAMGRLDEALALLPRDTPTREQDWIGYHLRGMILLRTGDAQDAERIFMDGVENNPFSTSLDYYRSALAVVRLRRREYRATLELLAQVTLPALEAPANALRTHAYGSQREGGLAAEAFAHLPAQGSPALVEVREELRRRFIDHEPPLHDEDWLIEREIDLLEAA